MSLLPKPLLPRVASSSSSRRAFLARAAALGAGAPLVLRGRVASATPADARSLALEHLHTGERLSVTYAIGKQYVASALQSLNRFLRDHYSGAATAMDATLFDQLVALRRVLGSDGPFQVISGYRSPETNERLRRRGGGVARASLHLSGRALDIRLPGVALGDVRDAALDLRAGGVGFYPGSNFVHLDTGPVRSW